MSSAASVCSMSLLQHKLELTERAFNESRHSPHSRRAANSSNESQFEETLLNASEVSDSVFQEALTADAAHSTLDALGDEVASVPAAHSALTAAIQAAQKAASAASADSDEESAGSLDQAVAAFKAAELDVASVVGKAQAALQASKEVLRSANTVGAALDRNASDTTTPSPQEDSAAVRAGGSAADAAPEGVAQALAASRYARHGQLKAEEALVAVQDALEVVEEKHDLDVDANGLLAAAVAALNAVSQTATSATEATRAADEEQHLAAAAAAALGQNAPPLTKVEATPQMPHIHSLSQAIAVVEEGVQATQDHLLDLESLAAELEVLSDKEQVDGSEETVLALASRVRSCPGCDLRELGDRLPEVLAAAPASPKPVSKPHAAPVPKQAVEKAAATAAKLGSEAVAQVQEVAQQANSSLLKAHEVAVSAELAAQVARNNGDAVAAAVLDQAAEAAAAVEKAAEQVSQVAASTAETAETVALTASAAAAASASPSGETETVLSFGSTIPSPLPISCIYGPECLCEVVAEVDNHGEAVVASASSSQAVVQATVAAAVAQKELDSSKFGMSSSAVDEASETLVDAKLQANKLGQLASQAATAAQAQGLLLRQAIATCSGNLTGQSVRAASVPDGVIVDVAKAVAGAQAAVSNGTDAFVAACEELQAAVEAAGNRSAAHVYPAPVQEVSQAMASANRAAKAASNANETLLHAQAVYQQVAEEATVGEASADDVAKAFEEVQRAEVQVSKAVANSSDAQDYKDTLLEAAAIPELSNAPVHQITQAAQQVQETAQRAGEAADAEAAAQADYDAAREALESARNSSNFSSVAAAARNLTRAKAAERSAHVVAMATESEATQAQKALASAFPATAGLSVGQVESAVKFVDAFQTAVTEAQTAETGIADAQNAVQEARNELIKADGEGRQDAVDKAQNKLLQAEEQEQQEQAVLATAAAAQATLELSFGSEAAITSVTTTFSVNVVTAETGAAAAQVAAETAPLVASQAQAAADGGADVVAEARSVAQQLAAAAAVAQQLGDAQGAEVAATAQVTAEAAANVAQEVAVAAQKAAEVTAQLAGNATLAALVIEPPKIGNASSPASQQHKQHQHAHQHTAGPCPTSGHHHHKHHHHSRHELPMETTQPPPGEEEQVADTAETVTETALSSQEATRASKAAATAAIQDAFTAASIALDAAATAQASGDTAAAAALQQAAQAAQATAQAAENLPTQAEAALQSAQLTIQAAETAVSQQLQTAAALQATTAQLLANVTTKPPKHRRTSFNATTRPPRHRGALGNGTTLPPRKHREFEAWGNGSSANITTLPPAHRFAGAAPYSAAAAASAAKAASSAEQAMAHAVSHAENVAAMADTATGVLAKANKALDAAQTAVAAAQEKGDPEEVAATTKALKAAEKAQSSAQQVASSSHAAVTAAKATAVKATAAATILSNIASAATTTPLPKLPVILSPPQAMAVADAAVQAAETALANAKLMDVAEHQALEAALEGKLKEAATELKAGEAASAAGTAAAVSAAADLYAESRADAEVKKLALVETVERSRSATLKPGQGIQNPLQAMGVANHAIEAAQDALANAIVMDVAEHQALQAADKGRMTEAAGELKVAEDTSADGQVAAAATYRDLKAEHQADVEVQALPLAQMKERRRRARRHFRSSGGLQRP